MRRTRLLAALTVGALLVVTAAVGVWLYVGRVGESSLERWIGEFLRGVVQAHLEPQLAFESLDYQAPYTVEITGLTLRDTDLDLLRVERASLTLAELPRRGAPLRIARIELDQPALHFVQLPAGGFRGWSDALRSGVTENYKQQVPEGKQLSDVLRLEYAALRNGALRYTPASDDPDLIVNQLDATLESPTGAAPGVHQLAGTFDWSDLLQLTLDGDLNLDAARLDLRELALAGHLTQADYATLPPQLQSLLKQYPLAAHLSATLSGTFLLNEPHASEAELQAHLRDAELRLPEGAIQIDAGELTANLRESRATAGVRATLLDGSLTGGGSLNLRDAQPFRANLRLTQLNLARAAQHATGNADYAGKLDLTAEITGTLSDFPASLDGPLQLEITQAKLVVLPLLQRIQSALDVQGTLEKLEPKDEARVEGRFQPDHLAVTRGDYVGALVAARAEGKVFYDQRLDLLVNAGPLQKLEATLGGVGDLLSKVTGKLAPLRVAGTVAQPQVKVEPLGMQLP